MQNHGNDTHSVGKKQDLVSTPLKQQMRQTIKEGTRLLWKESVHHLQTFNFAKSFDWPSGKGAFEMCHLFLCLFSLVCISEFLYVNFSSACVWCTVRISSKGSTTADPFSSGGIHGNLANQGTSHSVLCGEGGATTLLSDWWTNRSSLLQSSRWCQCEWLRWFYPLELCGDEQALGTNSASRPHEGQGKKRKGKAGAQDPGRHKSGPAKSAGWSRLPKIQICKFTTGLDKTRVRFSSQASRFQQSLTWQASMAKSFHGVFDCWLIFGLVQNWSGSCLKTSGRGNANFCIYYAYKSSCTQNHGNDVCNLAQNGTLFPHVAN